MAPDYISRILLFLFTFISRIAPIVNALRAGKYLRFRNQERPAYRRRVRGLTPRASSSRGHSALIPDASSSLAACALRLPGSRLSVGRLLFL